MNRRETATWKSFGTHTNGTTRLVGTSLKNFVVYDLLFINHGATALITGHPKKIIVRDSVLRELGSGWPTIYFLD